MELAPGIVIADRFRLVRPLGQGGMGAVWLAQHIALDIPCAVKFIHEEAAKSPDLRARFEREAKAAAQLRSPHVVQILDHGVWQGAPYIAMEFLDGEDLGQRLRRRGALPPREILDMAAQVGRALAKAHGVGLVHRDLKPANIFLVRDEEREIAKVLDFGVAKIKETGLDGTTQTGAVLGTPHYMSPEQARGSRDLDHRSDLWALAVVVYRCVTGRLPFRGEALGDLFVKIIVEPLPVPSEVPGNPSIPLEFDAWWARAAARDPALRFQTAKELSDALGVALGVTLSPPSPGAMERPVAIRAPSEGTVLTPSRPVTPYVAGSGTPYPSEATIPLTPPGAGPGQASPTPWPNGAPTPAQQAMSVHVAPPPGRGAVVVTAVGAGLVLGGALFFALWSSAPHAATGTATAAAAPPTAAAPTAAAASMPALADSPFPVVTLAPAVTTTPAAGGSGTKASPTVTAPPRPPTATAAKGPGASKPPAVPAGSKPKTDFGF